MISVCIATFNGEKYIREQIRSIASQISLSDEIIVSDDGSTDKTMSIIKNLNMPNIRIFQHSKDHGYTANFENAITHSKGDIIFLSDQDDIWLPNKVKVCVEQLKESDMVISDAKVVDEKLKVISNSFFSLRNTHHGWLNNIIKFGYLGCCMAFKRKILEKASPFPKSRRMCTHDNWLTLIGLSFYHVKIIEMPLILYRRHNQTTSNGGFNNSTSFFFKIEYRLYLLMNLIHRYSHTSNLGLSH